MLPELKNRPPNSRWTSDVCCAGSVNNCSGCLPSRVAGFTGSFDPVLATRTRAVMLAVVAACRPVIYNNIQQAEQDAQSKSVTIWKSNSHLVVATHHQNGKPLPPRGGSSPNTAHALVLQCLFLLPTQQLHHNPMYSINLTSRSCAALHFEACRSTPHMQVAALSIVGLD